MSKGNRFPELYPAREKLSARYVAPSRFMIGRLVEGHPNFEDDVLLDGIRGVQGGLVPHDEVWGLPYLGHNLVTDPRTRPLIPDETTTRQLLANKTADFDAMREKVNVDLIATEYLPVLSIVSKNLWPNPAQPLHSAKVVAILDRTAAIARSREYAALRRAVGIKTNKPPRGSSHPLSRVTVLQVIGSERALSSSATRLELLRIVGPVIGPWTLTAVKRYKMPTND